MRRLSSLTVAALAALALVAPAATSGASAAPAHASSASSHDSAGADHLGAKKATLKLSASSKFSHVGQKGVKVTAKVKGAKGKVAFTVGKDKLGKVKLKNGKAAVRLPSSLPVGKYTVKAKFKGQSKKVKVEVYNSALTIDGGVYDFTISASTDPSDQASLFGSVLYDGKFPAQDGYVHIFRDGNTKGGYQGPDYLTFAAVDSTNGRWVLTGFRFFGEVQELGPGTYHYLFGFSYQQDGTDIEFGVPVNVTVVP